MHIIIFLINKKSLSKLLNLLGLKYDKNPNKNVNAKLLKKHKHFLIKASE